MSVGLRRGIIEQVVTPYTYKVRIINYDSDISDPNKTLTSDLPEATVMVQPGTSVSYNEGDRVIVGFNKDELSNPIILGSMSTVSYPTDSDQISLPKVEEVLENLQETVSNLSSGNLFTHFKYSNDNGKTLTSLYEYADVKVHQDAIGQATVRTGTDIEIDPNSSTVYWSIIDKNNINVTNDFTITTKITATGPKDYNIIPIDMRNIYKENPKGENEKPVSEYSDYEISTDKVITIPGRLKNFDSLTVDFEVVTKPDYDENYYTVLTTDKNVIGSVYGDYLGICITADAVAPDTPAEYTWTSFNKTITNFVHSIYEDLGERLKEAERALFGEYDDEKKITDDTGIMDAISVTEDQIDIHGEDKSIVFNINKSMFIDNKQNNFTVEELRHTSPSRDSMFIEHYGADGHLTLYVRSKAN